MKTKDSRVKTGKSNRSPKRQPADGPVEEAVAKLQHSIGQAIEALQRNLRCGDPLTEIQAATEIMNATFAFLTAEHLLRLDRVEERLTTSASRKKV